MYVEFSRVFFFSRRSSMHHRSMIYRHYLNKVYFNQFLLCAFILLLCAVLDSIYSLQWNESLLAFANRSEYFSFNLFQSKMVFFFPLTIDEPVWLWLNPRRMIKCIKWTLRKKNTFFFAPKINIKHSIGIIHVLPQNESTNKQTNKQVVALEVEKSWVYLGLNSKHTWNLQSGYTLVTKNWNKLHEHEQEKKSWKQINISRAQYRR